MTKRIIALGPADALPRGLVQDIAADLQVDRGLTMDIHYMHGTPNLQPLEEAARRGQATLYCYFAAGTDRQMMARGVPVQFVPCAFRDIGAAMVVAGVTDLYHAGRSWDGVDISFGSCCGYSQHLLTHGKVRLHLEDNINLRARGRRSTPRQPGLMSRSLGETSRCICTVRRGSPTQTERSPSTSYL